MKKVISFVLVCLSVMLAFTGCEEVPTVAVAVVLGIHENFPEIPFSSERISEPLYDAAYGYGEVFVVLSEGKPKLVGDYDIEGTSKSISKTKRIQNAKRDAAAISYQCQTFGASSSEVDTLAAINIAADALQSSDCDVKKLIVIDSGLCTTGLLDQTKQDVISSDTGHTVSRLAEFKSIPELDGVEVTWIGAGRVAGEQDVLPDSYADNLESMWNAILEAGGANTVEFDSYPISGDEAENLPSVTPVSFPKNILDVIPKSKEAFKEPIKIDATTLKFVANKAEFMVPDEAREVLSPLAITLSENPDVTVYIVGTTASAGDGYALSKRRAEITRDVFLEYGVSASQIICEGLGSSDNCFHVDDLDEHGNLIESEAKKNRAIYIFSTDSDTAKSLFG